MVAVPRSVDKVLLFSNKRRYAWNSYHCSAYFRSRRQNWEMEQWGLVFSKYEGGEFEKWSSEAWSSQSMKAVSLRNRLLSFGFLKVWRWWVWEMKQQGLSFSKATSFEFEKLDDYNTISQEVAICGLRNPTIGRPFLKKSQYAVWEIRRLEYHFSKWCYLRFEKSDDWNTVSQNDATCGLRKGKEWPHSLKVDQWWTLHGVWC